MTDPAPPTAWERDACEACQSRRLAPCMDLLDASGLHYDIAACRDCRLLQLSRIRQAGSSGRAVWEGDRFTRPNPQGEAAREGTYRRVLSRLERYGAAPGRMLSVGCSFAGDLQIGRQMGYRVCGVDLSPVVLRYLRDEQHIPAYPSVAEALEREGPFDVVLCLETLYYFRRPAEDLRGMHEALRDGGLLVVKSRANRAWIYRAARALGRLRGRALHLRPGGFLHGHMCGGFYSFSAGNLRRLLERTGFAVLGVHNEDDRIRLRPAAGAVRLVKDLLRRAAQGACDALAALTAGRLIAGLGVTLYARKGAAGAPAV